ncbi:hypothetical protein COOONC_18962 [Cooperia oncophora]
MAVMSKDVLVNGSWYMNCRAHAVGRNVRTVVQEAGSPCNGNVVELLPKQLYFASFKAPPHKADPHVRYIDLDNRVHYEPFYGDFGPLNLSVLYRFTRYLHGLVEVLFLFISNFIVCIFLISTV